MTTPAARRPVVCRICGAPGRLYTSGRWCSTHLPPPIERKPRP